VCVAVALVQFCRAQNNATNETVGETTTVTAEASTAAADSNATQPAPPSYAEVDVQC